MIKSFGLTAEAFLKDVAMLIVQLHRFTVIAGPFSVSLSELLLEFCKIAIWQKLSYYRKGL